MSNLHLLSANSPFYSAHCIKCRLPEESCVCSQLEHCEMPFSIIICAHPREWQKYDNTGQWAYLSSRNIERIKWHRKVDYIPCTMDLNNICHEEGNYLLYPSDDAEMIYLNSNNIGSLSSSPNDNSIKNLNLKIIKLWIIDGTWQESQKMLRQSSWLNSLPKVKIASIENQPQDSQFVLRRNQKGLSTIEAISAIASTRSSKAQSVLDTNFHLFQNAILKLIK